MTLQQAYRPGAEQAKAAHRYFAAIAAEWVDNAMEAMHPMQLSVSTGTGMNMNIRLWSLQTDYDELRELLPWIRKVYRKMRKMGKPTADPMRNIPDLLICPVQEATCFVEVLGGASFTTAEKTLMSIGVRNGVTIFISVPNVMMVALEQDLFGLAVHQRGSWLIEMHRAQDEQLEIYRH